MGLPLAPQLVQGGADLAGQPVFGAAAGALRLRAQTHADPDARRADIAAALELARR